VYFILNKDIIKTLLFYLLNLFYLFYLFYTDYRWRERR
jgi:hypothetical protein